MKWRERIDLMADITQEEIDTFENGSAHYPYKEISIASAYDNDQSDFIITKQTNTMIIILKGYIPFNTTNVNTMISILKVYLLNNPNIQKVHVIVSPKISYDTILNFLIVAVPLLSKYIKKKIVVHHYNTLKLISKRIPSILNALPSYIKKRIIIDGSRGVTIGHMNFLYIMMDGMYVLTVRKSRL